jgi:hypothetical protein
MPTTDPRIVGIFANFDTKDFSFRSPTGSTGVFYTGGFYRAPAADANLNEAGPTQAYGSANASHASHAFLVAGGAGAVDAGSCSIVVSGTSIDDQGNRTAGDSEVLVADITAMSADDYYETAKKWIGQVIFTLVPAGAAAYSADFNYGFCKYDDVWDIDFTIVGFEVCGEAGANDAGFNLELLHHIDTGWTYSAAAFEPGASVLANMNVDHGVEQNLVSGENFTYKRGDLSQFVNGDDSEGFLIRITTGANNSVRYLNAHVRVRH